MVFIVDRLLRGDWLPAGVIRDCLPMEVHREVFNWVLRLLDEKKLVNGKKVGVDSTTQEANAAMKSIVRRDKGGRLRDVR